MGSSTHLLDIISQILDYSRSEAGRIELRHVPFDPVELVEDLVHLDRPRAAARGLELTARIDDDLPRTVMGDPGRLRQILINLVGNAIKFTERGGVTIRIGRQVAPPRPGTVGERDGTPRLVFSVEDTGVGIPDEALERIFEKFTQVDGTLTRAYEGTGLGLAITRRLVELMGGHVTVRSHLGRGSTFIVDVPLQLPGEADGKIHSKPLAPSPPPPPEPTESIRRPVSRPDGPILVVEDNVINQKVLHSLLEKLGHRATVVSTGRIALEHLAAHPVSLVFMDLQMPDMDGLEATRTIRGGKAGVLDPSLPIVAVTAHALERDRARCLEAGMDEVLTKPIEPDALSACLRRFLSDRDA